MFVPVLLRELLSPVHTGDYRHSATRRFWRQSPNSATVASVDRLLVLKGQAHAREMNSEFNAVSVTFESRPIFQIRHFLAFDVDN